MSTRSLVAVAVVAAWSAGIAVFAQREMERDAGDRLAAVAVRVSPGAEYHRIDRNGAHAGFASTTIDTVPGGLQISTYVVTNEETQGRVQRVTVQRVVRASRALRLLSLRETVADGGTLVTREARPVSDSLLRVVTTSAASRDSSDLAYTAPLLVPEMIQLVAVLGGRDQRSTWPVLDVRSGRIEQFEVQIRAESVFAVVDSAAWDGEVRRWRGVHTDSVRAWHVTSGDGAYDLWVDELGWKVMSSDESGVLRRTAYELAFENWRNAGRGELDSTAAPSRTMLPLAADSATLDSVIVELGGLDFSRLAVQSDYQRYTAGRLVVIRARITNASPGFWLPLHRRHRPRYVQDLRVEPLIEVEDPAIAGLARALRRKAGNDPRAVARVIAHWVSDSVATDDQAVLPSAGAVLRSRAGSNDGRVNLFVALARAADVPTRAVSGALVVNGKPHFHSWAEVYSGQWLPVDPVYGQFPADARRVRLVIAGSAVRDELTRVLSRARWSLLASFPQTGQGKTR
ncbi:MAG: transglutaminase-like domain-containing protein [Gemmatimonadota bacterium]